MKAVMNSRTLRALSTRARIAGVIVAVAFAGLFMAACKDNGPLFVGSVVLTETAVTVPVSGTHQFTVVIEDTDGNVLVKSPTWSIVSGGGTISSNGLFTAGTIPGTTVISVTCFGFTATATITVNAGAGASIVVAPDTTLVVGATAQFRAVVRDAFNNIVTITPGWSVINPVAGNLAGTINPTTGLFTAGNTVNTFPNSVQACIPATAICDQANVTVTSPPASLGSLSGVGILAGSTVTCVTGGVVNADIDIYAGSALVGFGPCVLTGATHLADAVAQQAQADLLVLHNTVFGLPCGTVVGTADIGGSVTPLPAGVYCSGSTIGVTGNLTLDGGGDPNATFVFQAGSSLTGVGNIILINGAQAKNVYWVNGAAATIGVGSAWQGNILAVSSITLNDNVTLLGRALTRIGAVTLGNNNVITLP